MKPDVEARFVALLRDAIAQHGSKRTSDLTKRRGYVRLQLAGGSGC